jgi:hypothetical protein
MVLVVSRRCAGQGAAVRLSLGPSASWEGGWLAPTGGGLARQTNHPDESQRCGRPIGAPLRWLLWLTACRPFPQACQTREALCLRALLAAPCRSAWAQPRMGGRPRMTGAAGLGLCGCGEAVRVRECPCLLACGGGVSRARLARLIAPPGSATRLY